MNPSIAGADRNDPTVTKETYITKRGGGRAYVKCNVMDWISTDQRVLRDIYNPCSIFNDNIIKEHAYRADKIVCAWGRLHPKLEHHADLVLDFLQHNHYKLWCLGTNKDGSPKHSLYLRNDTKPVRFYP